MDALIDFRGLAEDRLAAHPDEQLYFLCDHAGLPGLKRLLDHCPMPWASLFSDTRESMAFSVAPILVSVGRSNALLPRWFFDSVAQQGAYASAVTLLASRLSFEDMKRRLVARLDIELSEKMNAMLRFFDPRILAQLRTILTKEQATAFFGVATHWWYIDRAAVLREFDATFTLDDGDRIPLALTSAQEFGLVDASEADQVLSILNVQLPNFLNKVQPDERYGFIVENVVKARALGLDSSHDFAIYVTAILLIGDKWVRQKFPSRVSEDYAENKIAFLAAMEELCIDN